MSNTALSDPVLETFAQSVGASGTVAVEGSRTAWNVGGDLVAETRLLKAPSGIVSYVPQEMVIKVRAGTTVAELDSALAEQSQRSALADRGGTVGGAIAVGHNHVLSMGLGRIRNALLAVSYVSAEGTMVSGGGPTVKNVSGFDLPRLVVGSLGTLGLIAEVVIRTNPIPAVAQWLASDDADPFIARDAVLNPSAVLWNGTRTWILLEGHGPDVAAEAAALAAAGSFTETAPPALLAPELPHRWSLKPSELRSMQSLDTGEFMAGIGTGLVFAQRPQPARALSPELLVVSNRMKDIFDPTARLNPGRKPWASTS